MEKQTEEDWQSSEPSLSYRRLKNRPKSQRAKEKRMVEYSFPIGCIKMIQWYASAKQSFQMISLGEKVEDAKLSKKKYIENVQQASMS